MLGKLESIWRYPVKSMRGEEVDEVFVAFIRPASRKIMCSTRPASKTATEP